MNKTQRKQGTQEEHTGEASDMFMRYVRTKALFQERLRRGAPDGFVHIPQKKIERNYFTWPEYDRTTELKKLVNSGKLSITSRVIDGRDTFFYRCNEPGPLALPLMEVQDDSHYKPIHFEMRKMLLDVSLKPGSPSTEYFNVFLRDKDVFLTLFFRVDTFAGRVHTPITNFHAEYRPNILLDGSETVSFDVAQMQPLLLGKILQIKIGNNEYSEALDQGKDIYQTIALKAGLGSRAEGKKRFFEIIFAPANKDLVKMFGNSPWITWINDFKTMSLPQNPHNRQKQYSNMAWGLQTMEVRMMQKVWQKLWKADIKFLSVHDEIIVRDQDRHEAEGIFRGVLDQEFKSYKLNVKSD